MIININGVKILDKVRTADSFFKRFIGLMGVSNLEERGGLLLFRCSSIHCFFMKITIDAVYLSKEMKVLKIETLKPWQIGKIVKGSSHVLELKGNTASDKINIGDQLDLR